MSKVPLLSVIVPTRNRSELARACVAKLLKDLPEGVEIVILENSDQPTLTAVDFGNNPSVCVYPSEKPLDMPSNWERGLSLAHGKYIAYIADKDMFLPGALRRLVKELATGKHEILCYRKAWFCSIQNRIDHYRCFGGIHYESLKPLLGHFFQHFAHMHSAPMVYNSAVSVEIIKEIKSNHPRFFIGNYPDVITSILLAAYREKYSQMDEILSVGHSGNLNNGYGAIRFGGRSQIIQDFLKLFPENPLIPLHLPICLATGMLEVALKAKRAHPQKLLNYNVNWQCYLRDLESSIQRLEISEKEKQEDRKMLASFKCAVPRLEYFKFRFTPFLNKIFQPIIEWSWRRPVRLKMRLFPKGFGLGVYIPRKSRQKLSTFSSNTQPPHTPWWSNAHQDYHTPATSIGEALEIAAKSNLHLTK